MFVKEKNPDRKKKKRCFNFTFKKQAFSTSILETSSWLVFHDWFPMKFVFTNNNSLVRWELNKRRSKVHEKYMSCKHALNFDQQKICSKNYKPMRAWLWLVYKFTDNYCRSRLYFSFQTQEEVSTSFDKVLILSWKLLVISS